MVVRTGGSIGRVMAMGGAIWLAATPAARACVDCGCPAGSMSDLMAAFCPDMKMGAATQAEASAFDFASAISAAAPSTTNAYVYDFDFSTDQTGSSAVDPVITVGDTVKWTWVSGFHSVTSVAGSAGAFNSGDKFTPGDTFSHTFTTPGVYQYYCDIHGFDAGGGNAGGMSGTITVLAATPEPATLAGMLAFGRLGLRRHRRA